MLKKKIFITTLHYKGHQQISENMKKQEQSDCKQNQKHDSGMKLLPLLTVS